MGYRRANNRRKKGRKLRIELTKYLMDRGYKETGWLASFWDLSSDTIRDYKNEAEHKTVSKKHRKKIKRIKDWEDEDTPTAVKTYYDRKMGNVGCFIATAAYGKDYNKELNLLRRLRDDKLVKTRLGRYFINLYYTFSPSLAKWISNSQLLSIIVIILLKPLIKVLEISIESE
jgi:hypothetical protein